ncbi:hypothetical protein [Pedococcus sp. P5_B7]
MVLEGLHYRQVAAVENAVVNSIAVSSGLSVWNESDGSADLRHVVRRVEFLLDSQPLSSLLEQAGDAVEPESYVTVFEVDPSGAREVLQGQRRFEDWLTDTERIPIMVCPCGDLLCGALTVQLETNQSMVRWSNWAWDNYHEPLEPIGSIPTFEFSVDEYLSALLQATRGAREGGVPMTRTSVRSPRHSWRSPLRFGFERTDSHAMLDRLDVELLESRLDEPEQAGLLDMLTRLGTARDAIPPIAAGSSSAQTREELLHLLESIAASPQRIFLPTPTLASVQWHRDRLSGSG